MDIRIIEKKEYEKFYEEIIQMLIEGDDEFVPPLSMRSSTTQKDLKASEKSENGVMDYFEGLKEQKIMVAVENDMLVAFLSYRENYTNDIISSNETPNIYISTLLVKPAGRGKRLTQTMYGILFDTYKERNIFTRTWSTNDAHIRILSKFGFETLHVIENDRGNGIDTVYFSKRPQRGEEV